MFDCSDRRRWIQRHRASPPTTTDYLLCICDASGEKLSAEARAGGTCGSNPCLKALGAQGFRYREKTGTPDGLVNAILRAGGSGKGKLRANGPSNSPRLPLLPLKTPVRVQLQNSNSACWEATYSTATTNTTKTFKASSD